jgi:hypothetical protein
MANYSVPSNIYGDPFSQALDRLEDIASQTIIKAQEDRKANEMEYRATMMNIMMKNAPHINWSHFGNPLENASSFKAASSVYQDWLSTSQSGVDYVPEGNVLSGEAASTLTPPSFGTPYTDVTELGVTSVDVGVVDQWITGEGDQARSMGWDGLINQVDEDGEPYIDDADFSELTDMGLIRAGENWVDARPKLKQRWNWWQSAYKAENESFKGINEYIDLEDQEVARRNTALTELVNSDPDYATNRNDLTQVNELIQGTLLVEDQNKYKDENDVLQIDNTLYYKNITMPAGLIVLNDDGETVPLQQASSGAIPVSTLNQMIELNRGNNPEWVADVELLQKFTSFSTIEEIASLLKPVAGGVIPMNRLQGISPEAAMVANNLLNKAKTNQRKEDEHGVSNYKSAGELITYKTEAAVSLEAYKELNIDLGLNTGGTGLIDTFKTAYQSGQQQDIGILKSQLGELVAQYALRIQNSEGTDANAQWILDYLKSMDPSGQGNALNGMFTHFEKILVEE